MARLRRADGAGSLGEKVRNTRLRFDLSLQPGLIVARQPADKLVDFFPGPVLPCRLLDVHWIHLGERRPENAMFRHGAVSHTGLTRIFTQNK
jgi:hypothetical protein